MTIAINNTNPSMRPQSINCGNFPVPPPGMVAVRVFNEAAVYQLRKLATTLST